MIRREIKFNFKNFMIWTLILISIFLIVFLMYPTIMDNKKIEMLNETMKMFPKEMLVAFNMDISNIDSAFGWIKTEGITFMLLIMGLYSCYLGSNILLKEESEKTIEYLNSLPISRNKIVLNKVFVSFIYILLMDLILLVFNYIGLSLTQDFDIRLFLLISIVPLFTSIVFFSISLFISTFTHKTKKIFGISFAFVFISYFFNIFSSLSDNVSNLKYLSIFTLADVRNVITNIKINPLMVIITLLLSSLFILLSVLRYNNKDLL